MKKLEEGVLGVGGWLAEEDRAGRVLDVVTAAGDGLAVRLHGELLQVGGESVHVLVESKTYSQQRFKYGGLAYTYGATRCVWAPKKSEYHTLRRPPMTGMFSSSGAVLKWWSMA